MNEASQNFKAFMVHPDWGSEAIVGRLFVDRWRVRFQSEALEFEIPLEQLELKLGHGEDARVYLRDRRHSGVNIFMEDDAVLECASFVQSGFVRRQLEAILGRRELVRRLRVTLYFFIGCGFAAWLCSLAAGVMLRSLVNEIPMTWETKMGNALMEQEAAKLPFVDDSNAVAQLTLLARPLLRAIPAKDIHFRFHILDADLPNAFALPGGHIIVTTGLLRLADRPDELLGVIAHEMAHVTQRHAFRHLISGKGPVFLLQVFMGGQNRLLEALAYPSEKLVYESFSQEYEREADDIGWDYLVAARINPHGMIDIFRKLRNYGSAEGVLSRTSAFDSHPSMDRRIGWLEAKWNQLPDKTGFIQLTNALPKIDQTRVDSSMQKLLRRR
jgi:Zn-dependent protease with chaperone function